MVAVARSSSDICGVGAIKRKRAQYTTGIARKSGYTLDPNIHELGYVAVKKSHRGQGISKQIVASLLAATGERPLFATTSNPNMKRTLEQAGFVQRGNEWPGEERRLSVWVLE